MNPWRMLSFLLTTQGIAILLHWHVGTRLSEVLEAPPCVQRALWGAFALLFLSIPAALALARTSRLGTLGDAITWIGYAWMGAIFLLWTGALLGDALALVAHLAGLVSGHDPSTIARILRAASLAAALVGIVAGIAGARERPEIHEVEIFLDGLPAEFDGYRIAQVTDTHVSRILGAARSAELARRVDSAAPDLVVHTGDLVDGTVADRGSSVAPLDALRGRDGTIFVSGNHESYSGLASWLQFARGWGWTVLRNQHVILHRGTAILCVAGVNDANEGHVGGDAPDVRKALEGVPPGTTVVLLAHQPRQVFQTRGLGVSLQLSGHTHGGQIWPFHYLVRLQQPVVSGLHRLAGTQLFVSRGTGFWGPPLRLFAPPEIPVLVLRRRT